MIHAQPEIGAKFADLNPRPHMIENRLVSANNAPAAASDAERDDKCDHARHADRRASDSAAEQFAVLLKPSAENPVRQLHRRAARKLLDLKNYFQSLFLSWVKFNIISTMVVLNPRSLEKVSGKFIVRRD